MGNRGLLRFSTAGSVDDGKSTLIGRLLFDAKSIFEDQLHNLVRTTAKRGGVGGNVAVDFSVDLALVTDGLIAEREQGITIDVAYRYFATPRRKFIIADSPGHEQYTRNMVTGASTADLTIVLVDAKKGISSQSRRHALVASLLGIDHVVVAVNKMDLIDWSQSRFEALCEEFSRVTAKIGLRNISFIPMSALHGDMVVARGSNLDWYQGPTLLEVLETADVSSVPDAPLRFPVQLVNRPGVSGAFVRGYMGRIESGTVSVGQKICVEPAGHTTRIRDIVTLDSSVASASAPQSVTLLLEDELDVSRGDVITAVEDRARVARDFEAMLCWMDSEPMEPNRKYLIKHNTRTSKVAITRVDYTLDVETLGASRDITTLAMNVIGHVHLQSRDRLVMDNYRENRATGAFILIDEVSNHTVAAGMIVANSGGFLGHG